MNPLFQVHMLNESGKYKAQEIARAFDELLTKLETLCVRPPTDRVTFTSTQMEIVRAKLEEACFFAKKAMANIETNQQQPE